MGSNAKSHRRFRRRTASGVADIVLVPQGAIPITTSGKVRRSACLDRYRLDDFARLDAPV